jgi:hypothetical protein
VLEWSDVPRIQPNLGTAIATAGPHQVSIPLRLTRIVDYISSQPSGKWAVDITEESGEGGVGRPFITVEASYRSHSATFLQPELAEWTDKVARERGGSEKSLVSTCLTFLGVLPTLLHPRHSSPITRKAYNCKNIRLQYPVLDRFTTCTSYLSNHVPYLIRMVVTS